jgi:MFS family permease
MPTSRRKFFYGWILLPLCLTNILISNGISGSFSVIFVTLLAEFGLSRADLSGIYFLYIFVFFSGGAMAGRISGGSLSDRIGREWAYTLFVGFAAVAVFSLFFLNPERVWILWFYIVLAGMGMGVGGAMFPPMLGDLFPGPSLGKILGFTSLFAALGASFGSWFLGYLYDLTASYSWGLASLILAVGGAITFVWIAAPRKTSRRGLTEQGKTS